MNEIKAQELRLGNYVNRRNRFDEIELMQIKGITHYNTVHEEDDSIHSIEECIPIPLTDEWMVKFGLNIGQKYFPIFKENDRFFYKRSSGLDSESFIELEHVHKLQNLLFALYGEELTYE